jgi:hypothetical protein
MANLNRDCVVCGRLLLEARAALHNVGFARWQMERMQMCEDNLRTLDKLKEEFEPLKIRYEEARDYHKAIKGRLRRDYYHFLKLANIPPDPSMGIEAKAAALASLQVPDSLATERKRIAGIVKELDAAQETEQQACADYCVAHNELREFVHKTKKSAKECYMLAMRALKKRR